MNSKRYVRLLAAAVLSLSLAAGLIHAQGWEPESTLSPEVAPGASVLGLVEEAFSYQGRLVKDGTPVDGSCDLRFTLYDDEFGGTQLGPVEEKPGVVVSNGLFTTQLDFGNGAFNGEARWLEIEVRCPPDGDYTTLSPRQALRPAPYALALPGLYTQPHAGIPNVVGGWPQNLVWDEVMGATISGGGSNDIENVVTDRFGTIGGGANNLAGDESADTTDAWFATVGGGWQNRATSYNATVAGGAENTASGEHAAIGGGWNNAATENNATVSGGGNNIASGEGAAVGGGWNNTASHANATVSGGGDNTASGTSATVGGGWNNTASGEYNPTVAGGAGNTASGTDSTVGGGTNNSASAWAATVSGGYTNTVTAAAATVGGGEANSAGGGHAIVGGGESNTADGLWAAIGGGRDNVASANATTIGGGGSNEASNHYATIGGGGSNAAGGNSATVSGGQNNGASADYATVGGGASNSAAGFAAMVGGGRRNEANEDHSVVAGGYWNITYGMTSTISGGQQNFINRDYATIGGGHNNQVYANYGTVAGGGGDDSDTGNIVRGQYGTVGGGTKNVASGYASVIGGGYQNTTLGEEPGRGSYATIAGGAQNTAPAWGSTIGGGHDNEASGYASTVPGGEWNKAEGDYSFAAGDGAWAKHSGAFVWADHSSGNRFASTAENQFAVRATGGVIFRTDTESVQVDRLRIAEDGNVGIGTMGPETPLHIRDNYPYVRFEDTEGGNKWEVGVFGQNRDFRISEIVGSSSQGRLVIQEGGTVRVNVLQITGGSDLAEPFEIIGRENVAPGMVVAIDPQHPGQLHIADSPYDRTVVGCVSGAKGINPGLTIQQEGSVADGSFPVALSGRVYCWADASYGPIQPGDLLTTSDTAGHVMAVTDYQQARGAIIGKAMSVLSEGRGLVLVLISLQ